MGKRRRSASTDSSDSYRSRLRPKDGLRRPDRLSYGNQQNKSGSNAPVKKGVPKRSVKRFKWPPAPIDLYSVNRFTWKKRPKFMENVTLVETASDAGGDARSFDGSSGSVSCVTASVSAAVTAKTKSLDEEVFAGLINDTKHIFNRMYIDIAPPNLSIPAWFWGHLRPCDRFLLLKRLFVVELDPLDADVINSIASPEFADAKKVIKNLTQLHIVIGPDAVLSNSMKLPNVSAHLYEVHDKVRHPRQARRLQDASDFSVTVESRNHGRLNIFISGDLFTLKLWTDDKDFTRFVGHYQREVFPSVRSAFRATAFIEDSLSRDDDYRATRLSAIQKSFQRVISSDL